VLSTKKKKEACVYVNDLCFVWRWETMVLPETRDRIPIGHPKMQTHMRAKKGQETLFFPHRVRIDSWRNRKEGKREGGRIGSWLATDP